MTVSYIKPKFVIYNNIEYIISAFINQDIINNKTVYKYIEIKLLYLNYDNIISALINDKYTQDQITAITLNYLLTLHEEVLEPEKFKEYQEDYKKLQEYRALCKAEAKKAIEYAEINDIKP